MNVGELIKQLGHYPNGMPVALAVQPWPAVGLVQVKSVYVDYDFLSDREVVSLG